MWIVAIAWMYVAVMMTVAEATHPQGTVLGAIITFLFYGVAPVAIVMYILSTPARRRARRAAEAQEARLSASASGDVPGDEGHHPPSDAVTPERKEPPGV